MAASNSKQQAQLVINDADGMPCEHCKKVCEDVISITVGEQMFFVSLEHLVDIASEVMETGTMKVLVS